VQCRSTGEAHEGCRWCSAAAAAEAAAAKAAAAEAAAADALEMVTIVAAWRGD